MNLIEGREYTYHGQPVKRIEYWQVRGETNDTRCTVQTRFGETFGVWASELEERGEDEE